MEFNLNQILESTILLEGRKEDVIKKYGEEHKPLIDILSKSDPSGNNKYLDWMVKTALGLLNKEEDILSADSIINLISDFDNRLPGIKNKDLNSYKSVFDLKAVVDEANKKAEEKGISKQAKKVFENDDVVVYAPMTTEAACKYGAGSKWCIAGRSNNGGLNNYFDDYSKHSNFYYFINKKMTSSESPRHYKYALQWRFDGGNQEWTWWDAQDTSGSETPQWVTGEMKLAVRAFDPKHRKIKLGAQLNAYLENPTIRDYLKFSSMMEPKQKSSTVDRIIGGGSLDSNSFAVLSPDLTDQQKMEFINNYVKGSVSVSDYKKMEKNLTDQQKIALFIQNPTILNNYDVVKKVNDELTDEQKYVLVKSLDNKKINNTDSKVLVKKWSMTAEEREKHKQKSFYVFLSNPNNFVNSLTKVDPLNPESYRTINVMKLEKQVKPETNMYGIKTDSGLLDDYIGGSVDSIPETILNLLKSQSTKI